jgi:hypothetical protein
MANKTFKLGKTTITLDGTFNGITLLGAGISANAEGDDFRLALQLWPFGIFVGIFCPALKKLYKALKLKSANYGRNFGFGISKGGVFNIDFFGRDEKGNSKSLVYLELSEILGQEVYSEDEGENGKMEIELPEGEYKAEYRVFTSFWKRKFGFTSKLRRISIKMIEEIPMPAPAEPLRGVTMPYPEKQDLTDAKIAFINSVSHHRYQVGGKDWKPSNKESQSETAPESKTTKKLKKGSSKKKGSTIQKGAKRAKK